MVCSDLKGLEGNWKRVIRNTKEFVFLVRETHAEMFAYIANVAYSWVWRLFHERILGDPNEVPLSRAFPSSVAIDSVSRKNSKAPCITPTSPEPIPPGEEVTIYDLIDRGIPSKLKRRLEFL